VPAAAADADSPTVIVADNVDIVTVIDRILPAQSL
jgi:hypothetical protein